METTRKIETTKKEVLNRALSLLMEDLERIKTVVRGCFHPFRAVALCRAFAGLSAANVASAMKTSRTYLSALENYARPVTDDMYKYFDNLASSEISEHDGGFFVKTLEKVLGIEIADTFPYIEYYAFLEKLLKGGESTSDELVPQKVCAVFEALSFLTDFFEIFYDEIKEEYYHHLQSISLWPSGWPERKVPHTILCKPESVLFAYLFGVLSADQVMDIYVKRVTTPLPPISQYYVLMSISKGGLSTLYRLANSLALNALCAFLFDHVILDISYRFPKEFPVRLLCTFKNQIIDSREIPSILNYLSEQELLELEQELAGSEGVEEPKEEAKLTEKYEDEVLKQFAK
ncbi:MAG: hypothetical protein ACPLTR_12300, partial [Thermacetogeniaceae bacterium]